MLEGNIDAKDLEYIKAYSEFLVNHSPQSVVGAMKELALKGDLNATRFWYKYSKIGDCKELDDKMENMQPWSVDEGYALAFYNYQKEKDTLRNLLVERSNAVREYNAYADLFLLGGNVTTDKVAFLRMKKESINHQIDNLKFVKNLEVALTRAEKIFTTERNCYMLQKAFENRIITTVYLVGEGFEGGWMKNSLTFMCRGRRAFMGNNLYSKGACYAGMLRDYPEKWNCIYKRSCNNLGMRKLRFRLYR